MPLAQGHSAQPEVRTRWASPTQHPLPFPSSHASPVCFLGPLPSWVHAVSLSRPPLPAPECLFPCKSEMKRGSQVGLSEVTPGLQCTTCDAALPLQLAGGSSGGSALNCSWMLLIPCGENACEGKARGKQTCRERVLTASVNP